MSPATPVTGTVAVMAAGIGATFGANLLGFWMGAGVLPEQDDMISLLPRIIVISIFAVLGGLIAFKRKYR